MMTKQEWRWVMLCAVAFIVLLAAPAAWAWLAPPEGWQLYKTWAYGGDYTQYRSAMAQGYNGAWLVVNRFTPEPHEPILQYPLYVALGHVARWLRLPIEVPFILASAAAIVALACAIYMCAATFLPEQRDRKLAFLLTLSVGPAWLISVVQALIPAATFLNRYKNAFNRPEVNTFLLFAAAPHLPLALAILLFVIATLYRQWETGQRFPARRFILSYILPVLSLGLLNPFSLPTALLPLGLWWIVRSVQARRILWREAFPLLAMGLSALPLFVYNVLTFTQDPFWGKAYGSQNYQISFPPDVVLMGYGVMGLLAIIGAVQMWRARPDARFAPFYVIIVALMSYIPVNYQRRFSLGLAPMLALLAVAGWRWIAGQRQVRKWQQRRLTRVIGSVVLILCLWGQNIMFYSAYVMSHLGSGATPYAVFQPRALAAAAAYLDARGETATVLTCEEPGNLLAGEIRGRVVIGHAGATLNVEERRQEISDFFSGALSAAERKALLRKYHTTHLLTSKAETLECELAFAPAADWTLVFEQDAISVYTVHGTQ